MYAITVSIFSYLMVNLPRKPCSIWRIFAFIQFTFEQINWITGIGYSACCYIQLLVVCDAGKSVNDAVNWLFQWFQDLFSFVNIFICFQSDSVVLAINRFKFYRLPPKKQEMFSLILNRMQNGAKIQMGPFRKLDYEAATQVFNWWTETCWREWKCPISLCSWQRRFTVIWC